MPIDTPAVVLSYYFRCGSLLTVRWDFSEDEVVLWRSQSKKPHTGFWVRLDVVFLCKFLKNNNKNKKEEEEIEEIEASSCINWRRRRNWSFFLFTNKRAVNLYLATWIFNRVSPGEHRAVEKQAQVNFKVWIHLMGKNEPISQNCQVLITNNPECSSC